MKQLNSLAVLVSLALVSGIARAQERLPILLSRQVPGYLLPGGGSGADEHLLLAADPTLPIRLQGAIEKTLASVDSSVRHGVIAGVMMPGLGVWTGAAGLSDSVMPITVDMRMEIGSVSKTFVTATILQLVHEGKLTLADSIGRWLDPHDNVDGSVTIKQLLNHSSGISDFVNNDTNGVLFGDAYFVRPDHAWTPEEVLTHLGPPLFKPGAKTSYSNTNFLLLGMIAEKATGNSLADEIRSRFLVPLGLNATYLGWTDIVEGTFADGWTRGFDPNDPMRQTDIASIPRLGGLSLAGAAGGVVSTAGDLVRWADALYGGRVLDSASMKAMMTFKTTSEGDVGLGVFRWQYGSRYLYGHDGAIPGYSSWMFSVPHDSVSVVILLNSLHSSKDVGLGAMASALLTEIYRKVAAVEGDAGSAAGAMLGANVPNPFIDETSVRFTLPSRGPVTLEVFDALGRKVATPLDGVLSEGDHAATVRLDGMAGGTYFYVLRAAGRSEVRGMQLAR